jgi:hypothetical protein
MGNPYRIGPDGDRATVSAKYEPWLADQHQLLRALDELRARDVLRRPAMLPILARIADLLPTHTRRSEESQALQLEFGDFVRAAQQVVGELTWSIGWQRVRFRDDPPELMLMARHRCARTFPRRQMRVLALSPA